MAGKIDDANASVGQARRAKQLLRFKATRSGVDDEFDFAVGLAGHRETGARTLLDNFAGHVNAKTYEGLYGTWRFRDMDDLAEKIIKGLTILVVFA